MSAPPQPPTAGGEGLVQSTPLVTIAGGPPPNHNNLQGDNTAGSQQQQQQQQQSFTPAAGNHPLAAPPLPPPPPAANAPTFVAQSTMPSPPPPMQVQPPPHQQQQQQQQQLAQQTFASPPPPSQAQASPAAMPNQFASPPPPLTTNTPTKQQSTTTDNINNNTNNFGSPPAIQSLDELVDAFLSGPSYRTQQHLPALLRPPPLINESPLQCLRTLVERRAWGDVLQVTADLLRGADSVHAGIYKSMLFDSSDSSVVDPPSPDAPNNTKQQQQREETVEIVALQCHAWLKLRRYTDLGEEMERWKFLPSNDNFDPTVPSWVPWSLHIIAAETLLHSTDDPNRGTDELHALVRRIPDDSDEDLRWKLSTHRALANAFSRKKEWRMAMMALERILPHIESAARQELAEISSSSSPTITSMTSAQTLLEAAYRTELLSVQGRYLLHAGAVAEAGHLFQEAQTDWNQIVADAGATELAQHVAVQHVPAQLLANEGLLCFAYANYDQAIESFKEATDSLRAFSLSSVYRTVDWIGPTVIGVAPHATLFNECINNMAICALYTCRMHEAVNLMESLVREDPTAFLTERVAFNLCTMYELGCDTTASARKKRVLQLVAKRFFLHDVGPESFRIT